MTALQNKTNDIDGDSALRPAGYAEIQALYSDAAPLIARLRAFANADMGAGENDDDEKLSSIAFDQLNDISAALCDCASRDLNDLAVKAALYQVLAPESFASPQMQTPDEKLLYSIIKDIEQLSAE